MTYAGPFVIRNGELVPKAQAGAPPRGPRSDLPTPMLIRDGMDTLVGMHDGRVYESKSALRASYRAAGVIEVGSDAPTEARAPERPRVTKDEIGAAYAAVRDGYKPQIDFVDNAPNQTGWSEYVD